MLKKRATLALSALIVFVPFLLLTACKDDDVDVIEPTHTHEWSVTSQTATCGEAGTTSYACACGETKDEDMSATGQHSYGGNICAVCGYINFSGMTAEDAIEEYGYYVEDNDGSNTYSTGDSVWFGSYPQEQVDSTEALEMAAGTLPNASDWGDWTSYGYYSSGEVSDYMFYKDVTVDGEQYRAVYLLGYRPYYSGLGAGTDYSYIDDEGFELNTVYWFKYSPIQWNVLEYADGTLMLNSKYCIEAQPFSEIYEVNGEDYIIPGTDKYVNNWQYSTLRSFLNGTFYDGAFSQEQQSLILPAMLDNGTTGYSSEAPYQISQNDTQDKVFLLSYQDINNTSYGYTSRGATKSRSFTDYAVVQGLRTSSEVTTEDGEPSCFYSLRSAGDNSYSICGVAKNGSISYTSSEITMDSVDGAAINGDLGVLPALYIRVGKAAQGVWSDFTFDYTDEDGEDATATCSLYIPAVWVGGTSLPLITYIGDSSYTSASLTQYKAAECPTAWLTDEKMSEYPTFMLIICGSPSTSLVVSVIDSVVADYGIDEGRLYLTGQSMGGITDFLINDTYPDKFAATVYVGCQPGGSLYDEQYNAIIANAKFTDQKFIYIASRKDELASQGQDDVEAVLQEADITYGKLYGLDHSDAETYNAAIKEVLEQGYSQNFFGFTQITTSGNSDAEHMRSFKYAYAADAIFEWLMAQHI